MSRWNQGNDWKNIAIDTVLTHCGSHEWICSLSLRSVKTRDSGVDHNLGVGRNDSKGKRRRFREAE